MTINVAEYFAKPHSKQQADDAVALLERVNALLAAYSVSTGLKVQVDVDTGCQISGVARGDGDGGFRTPGSRTGGSGSSHREAKAVDVFDPDNQIDGWLDVFEAAGDTGENTKLAEFDLYREHPSATRGWCHLSTRAPGSGRRTFYP